MAAQCAVAATVTLSPGANITLAVEAAANGDTIQLNPGDYFPANTAGWVGQNAFGITKAVKIIGLGSSPSQVKLHGVSGIDYAVKFTRYVSSGGGTAGNPSGATLENLTLDTANGGVQILDYSSGLATRLTDITIKNVVIQTAMAGGSFGVLLQNTDRAVLDGVTITSFQSGLQLINANDSLIVNSTVTSTGAENAAGLGVFGGSGNTIVGNTIGTAKAVPSLDSGYSFKAGGVVFYNSQANRFENNTVQGHRDDGLDFHALPLPSSLAIPDQQSIDNYAGKNNIISTGFAAGRTAGSGIWVNCSANNTWLYANESQGTAECGTCVWLSKNNMLLANSLHNNRLAGIVVSGGEETPPYCAIPAFQQKPSANFLQSNNIFFNGNEQVVIRASDSTQLTSNFMSSKNGFGGASQACVTSGCQAAFALEGDPANAAATSSGVLVAANTSADNQRGIQGDDGKVSGLEMYGNRMLLSDSNRFVTASTLQIDRGANLGGNYWAQHAATGNPSGLTPYSGVFHSISNQTGLVVDRFPYQTEDLGRGQGVTVFEPGAGTAAQGTRRTVRWYAPGCTYADVLLDGTTALASNQPNTGYAVVTIPLSATTGAHTVMVQCKDSAGAVMGQGSSASFTVTDASLQLLAPGRDDVFNANTTVFVSWKKTAAVDNVNIEFSSDKGATFSTLLSGQTGSFARVTLPAIASTAYAVVRVTSGSAGDSTDGVFAVRGASGAGFANVTAGRKLVMGQLERLEWASPQNSRLVDITATVGGVSKSVASNLPDRGNFDWIVPDMGVGAVTLLINFKTTSGVAISSASNSLASTLYPTTITFGAAPSLGSGGNAAISATTNSAAPVTFTSLTTSVCTVSGSTVSGVTNGTCTIAADAAGNGSYNTASRVTRSFTVGSGQTITFGAAPTVVVDGTSTLSATASSGLAVTFSTLTSSVCGVSGSTVSGITAGTCTVAANQAGNPTFSTAPQVTQTFSVVVATSISRLANISTRGLVQTGDNVMIGGFIIGGSSPKKVLVRAVGPNLANFGVTGVLENPTLQLYSGGTIIAENDNWQTASNAAAIQLTGLAPASPLESAILATLAPGAYTAVVSGVGSTSGVGIVEVFEADHPEYPLINISTRGQVQTGNNVMIGGIIIQGDASKTVLIRAVGPNLANFGVTGVLQNPKLQLYNSGGTVIAENDNWETASNAADIQLTGLAPASPFEAAILITLPPGAYTAIVSGSDGGSGVGIIEVFAR
jgi:hypothetical protein